MNTRTQLDAFRKDFNETVKDLAKKYDVQIDLGVMRYDDISFKATLNVSNVQTNESGDVLSKEAQDYLKWLDYSFLPYSDLPELGSKFYSRGVEYTITGAKPRSRKYPILAKQVKGGLTYKFTIDAITKKFVK